MSALVTATLPNGRLYTANATELDRAIELYLPASVLSLRGEIEARTGDDWTEVHSVSTLLVVLATLDRQ